MKAALLIIMAIMTTLAVITAAPVKDSQWKDFMRYYNKSYASPVEEEHRYHVWRDNLRRVRQHNFEADLNRHSYRLGINAYSDLTRAEVRRTRFGFRIPPGGLRRRGSTFLSPSHLVPPARLDWRKHGYVTPVKDQGNCGSCYAFSATGALEGQHFQKTGRLVSLSEQNIVDCSGREGNEGCGGGTMDGAFEYVMENGGIDTEASYPYTAKNGNCSFKREDIGTTDSGGFVNIPQWNETQLLEAVAAVGPVSVAIDASYNFHDYKSGVFDDDACSYGTLDLNHGVLVVGYGTFKGKDYWLVKNSWGPSWGINGYIMMARNANNQCGIATRASYPLV